MKAKMFFLACFIGWGLAMAQEVNCGEKQKELAALVNDGKYKQAAELLAVLKKKCAAQDEAMYPLGITALRYNFDTAGPEAKDAALEELLKFYDLYDANFPKNKNGNLVQKALLIYEHKKENTAEAYSALNRAFNTDPAQFTTANSLHIYFRLCYENYKAGKDNLSLDELLQKYSAVQAALEKNGTAHPEKAAEFRNATLANTGLIKPLLTPDTLMAMAEKKFEANSQNPDWLASTATLLSERSAASSIFGKVAMRLHEVRPSSESAYHLGNYYLKNKDQKQAIAYFSKAADLAENPLRKAKIYYTVATILGATDKGESKKMIGLAIENDKNNGSYYVLLANLYASSANECGSSPLEQKAIYKLAARTAEKAGTAEPRLKPMAGQLSQQFAKNSLTDAEQKELKKAGGKVAIGCWINETVSF